MNQIGEEYTNHKVFAQLQEYSRFYESLSFAVFKFLTLGTNEHFNLDSYAFSSIKGTIDSINEILSKGRINDAYALLRKFYDSTMINVYVALYLDDKFSMENHIVDAIENWRIGKDTIPEFRVISGYIKESKKLKPITEILLKDDLYKKVRDRCNDNTHYNYYYNLLMNDNEVYNPNRIKMLDVFSDDLTAVFLQHFAYVFYLNEHYMSSDDYTDYLEEGMTPPEGSQYWVLGFVQEAFDKWVRPIRPDIAGVLKSKTAMDLK